MQEITRVLLENEMDIILANRRSMKLAELAGLTLSAQTSFATAVSEVSRSAVELNQSAQLVLCVEPGRSPSEMFLVASIREAGAGIAEAGTQGMRLAQRLVTEVRLVETATPADTSIEMRVRIPNSHRINPQQILQWRSHFDSDGQATSPYEEIKRKNKQLLDLADQLRASEAQYRTLTETLPFLVFTFNENQELSYINPWTERFTGQSMEQLSTQRWQQVYHPEDYEPSMLEWEESKRSHQPVNRQMRLKDAATGEYLWHLSLLIPQLDETGELRFWVGYAVDIHAQKVIEQTLRENKELIAIRKDLEENQAALQRNIRELAESNQELEQFAYVASHDLQEPLRKIMFYGDYLSRHYQPVLDGKGSMFLDNVVHSARRMQQLIRDVLAYSTIGRTPPQNEHVDLNAVATEALQDLEMSISEKNANVVVHTLPVVSGNAYQIRQLFENLLSNSLKYSHKERTPQITISAEQAVEGTVILRFRDNGIGFEDQFVHRIFNLFQRLHNRQEYEGTGVGPAICKRIAEVHNGSITGSGKPGEGAVFSVTLPVQNSQS